MQYLLSHPPQVWLILGGLCIASIFLLWRLYPSVERRLGLSHGIEALAEWLLGDGRWSRLGRTRRFFRILLVNLLSNSATQMLQAAILLPAWGALFGSIWLYRHLPAYWARLAAQVPWLAAVERPLVVVVGIVLFVAGYRLREAHARVYGGIEIGVAIAALFIASGLPSFAEGLLPFATAAYIGVRGLDNIKRGRKLIEDRRKAAETSV